MKYILIILLFATTALAQSNKSTVIETGEDGTLSLDNSSFIYRGDKVIFKSVLYKDSDNFLNFTTVGRCVDYSYIISIIEGKDKGEDYLSIGTQVSDAADKGTRINKALDIACKNFKNKPLLEAGRPTK